MHMCFNGFSFLNALMNQWKNCVYPLYLLSTTVVFAALTSLLTTFIIHQIFPIFKTTRVSKNISRIINTIASIWLSDYLAYLFLEAHSFIRAWLSENCSLLETDNVRGQISELIIHQIFLLACDWSKRVTRMNIPQLNLGNVRVIFPNFQILRVAQKNLKDNKHNSLHLEWKYNEIFVLGHHLCLKGHIFPRATLSENCSALGTDNAGVFKSCVFGSLCLCTPYPSPPFRKRASLLSKHSRKTTRRAEHGYTDVPLSFFRGGIWCTLATFSVDNKNFSRLIYMVGSTVEIQLRFKISNI